jgi:hypothetical protein
LQECKPHICDWRHAPFASKSHAVAPLPGGDVSKKEERESY